MQLALALVVSLGAALALVLQGLRATTLTTSTGWKRVIMVVAVAACLVACPVLYVELSPGDPAATATLVEPGDSMALEHGGPGLVRLQGKLQDGQSLQKSLRVVVRFEARGAEGVENLEAQLQVGDSEMQSEDLGAAIDEYLSANMVIGTVGEGGTLKLTHVAPEGLLAFDTLYIPQQLPLRVLLYVLLGLTVLGAALEGAGEVRYQRSFFTAALAGVTGLAWILQSGLTAGEGILDLALRVGYAIGIAAIAGTLLPMITGAVVPSLPNERTSEGQGSA